MDFFWASLRINKLLDKAEIVSTLDELWYKCIEGNDFKRFEEKDFLSFSWVELSINLDNKKIKQNYIQELLDCIILLI